MWMREAKSLFASWFDFTDVSMCYLAFYAQSYGWRSFLWCQPVVLCFWHSFLSFINIAPDSPACWRNEWRESWEDSRKGGRQGKTKQIGRVGGWGGELNPGSHPAVSAPSTLSGGWRSVAQAISPVSWALISTETAAHHLLSSCGGYPSCPLLLLYFPVGFFYFPHS